MHLESYQNPLWVLKYILIRFQLDTPPSAELGDVRVYAWSLPRILYESCRTLAYDSCKSLTGIIYGSRRKFLQDSFVSSGHSYKIPVRHIRQINWAIPEYTLGVLQESFMSLVVHSGNIPVGHSSVSSLGCAKVYAWSLARILFESSRTCTYDSCKSHTGIFTCLIGNSCKIPPSVQDILVRFLHQFNRCEKVSILAVLQ